MQLVVEETLIDYTDEGKGPVLLLVHGWRDSKETYGPLIAELKPYYRCVALDLPNFGKSQVNMRITSPQDYANFINAFSLKLNLKNFIIIGHSMGGQISIYGVGCDILSPKELILIAASGVRDNKKFSKAFLRFASKPLKRMVGAKAKQRFYKSIGSDFDPTMSEHLKKVINSMLKTDVQEQAKRISCPTLLVYGELDKQTPLWMGELLHQHIPNSQLVAVGGENHWLHQTSSKNLADRIREFSQ